MTERYIGVNRFCEWLKHIHTGFTKDELAFRDELIEFLQGSDSIENVLPTADVVPVVRCKDCRGWCRNVGIKDSPNGHCFTHDIDTNGFDFCSYGERRNDG